MSVLALSHLGNGSLNSFKRLEIKEEEKKKKKGIKTSLGLQRRFTSQPTGSFSSK